MVGEGGGRGKEGGREGGREEGREREEDKGKKARGERESMRILRMAVLSHTMLIF